MSGPLARLNAWRRARLNRRIAVPAISVTLLFLAALGFVAFRLGQRAVIEQVDARNRQLAVQVSGEIATFFQTQIDILRLQAERLLAADGPAAQGEALVRLRAQFPYSYNDLYLFDAEGRTTMRADGRLNDLVAAGAQRPDPPPEPDPAVVAVMAGRTLAISPIAFRPLTGTPYVTVILPLLRCTPAESPCVARGALQAQLDLRSFWTRVDGFRLEDGAISIVDTDGTVLAHSDRRQVGLRLDEATIAPLRAGLEGTTSYRRDGATYLAAYAPVGPPLGWGVIVEQERAVALRLVSFIGWATTLATVLSALALTLLLSNLIARVLRPLERLSAAAARIASSGDLRATTASDQPGEVSSAELATLSASFNQMIAHLREAQVEQQRWNDQLERRVTERTVQLQTVLEVARLSGGSLKERVVLDTLLDQIGRLVAYDAATVRLLDASGTQLDLAAARGTLVEGLPRRIPLDDTGLHATVISARVPRLVLDTSTEPAWQLVFGSLSAPGTWLAVPLLAQDHVIGILAVYSVGARRYDDEEAAILAALGAQVGLTLAHARLYEDSVRRVEQELQTARQIQKHLFPEHAPVLSGLDIATYYRPARETTGDFYSFVTPHQGTRHIVDLFIGDVSGKSLPAALLMTMARTALYAAASARDGDPVETLRRANAVLLGDMPRGSFVASTFARLDREAGTCALVNAAQPAPLLVRAGQAELLEGPGGHMPLGIVAAPEYEALTITLRPGDLLLFYTDGVIEAFSPAGELFGFERLEATLVACGPAPAHIVLDQILADVSAWMASAPQHDDIAMLAVRITDDWRP